MFSCLAVVTRGMRMMLCRLLMVLGCFLGHSGVSSVWWPVVLQRSTTERPHQRNRSFMTSTFSVKTEQTFGVEKYGWLVGASPD
jgi:hypothetical protein